MNDASKTLAQMKKANKLVQLAFRKNGPKSFKRGQGLLLNALRDMGYTCAQPDGAFYLFPRSLEPDARAFCERARKYDLVLVPGDSFGCPGHVRISYCVPTEQIQRALHKFEQLAAEYK